MNENPANITFTESDSTQNFLAFNKTQNAFELKKMGEDRFNDFVKVEQSDFDQFLSTNPILDKESLGAKLFIQKADLLTQKKIAFVKKYPNDYFSLYVFRGLSAYSYANADSLKKVFKSTFSIATQKSFEGTEIEKVLNGRVLAKGNFAPTFTSKDIKGNKISLENLKGKNVLLVFWATWCGPCVAEIPHIKEIRASNSVDKLEIISVSLDSNFDKYTEGLKEYDMNWTQIYGDNDLVNTYGVTGIPVVYLIDPSGKIVYSRYDEKDGSLTVLTKLLRDRLNN